MAKIFITGSADGLGQLAARSLANSGHEVVLHARNAERGLDAKKRISNASMVVSGDLSDMNQIKEVAAQVNELGQFDAVIHNAGVYRTSSKDIFMVNTLAPYILTCLIAKPHRLIYMSSGMHLQGRLNEATFQTGTSYSDSKLHVVMLAKAVARKWPAVCSNAVDPGWVPTKMGGYGAPDSLQQGYETQAWLAGNNDPKAKVSGKYFYHQKEKSCNPQANDVTLQEKFLALCQEITGISFPE